MVPFVMSTGKPLSVRLQVNFVIKNKSGLPLGSSDWKNANYMLSKVGGTTF